MSRGAPLRLRSAHPFTVIAEPDAVRLIAGEDLRYSLSAPGLDQWLPELLSSLDAGLDVPTALDRVAAPHRAEARSLLLRLREERVLIPPPALEIPPGVSGPAILYGECPLGEAVRSAITARTPGLFGAPDMGDGGRVHILCQDILDYEAALRAGARALAEGAALVWATEAPLARGFVSPLFLPDAGPCLACLIACFKRLSPSPELYDALIEHAKRGGSFMPTSIGPEPRAALAAITAFKIAGLAAPAEARSEAIFRLHVLDAKSFEVSTHPVPIDPDCPSDHHRL